MAFVSIVSMTAAVSQTSRPNLLWIMADDLGVGEPSFLSSETAVSSGRVIHTPRIDELAASGTFFTAAYAGYTVCAPSRATFFTGRSVGRLAGAPANWPLLPRLLGDAGYQTALFGKSAPMDDTTPGSELEWGLPARFGFERFRGDPNQAQCHNMYPTYLVDDTSTLPLPLNTKNKSRSLCMAHPQDYNYTTDVFTDAALHWLHSERLPTKPFFLYIAYTVPHAGGWGSAPSSPEQGSPVPSDLQYADRDWPEVERDHAASVTYLDLKLGRVLDGLDTLGLSTSTAVFFASDNGAHNEGGHDVRFFDSSRCAQYPSSARAMHDRARAEVPCSIPLRAEGCAASNARSTRAVCARRRLSAGRGSRSQALSARRLGRFGTFCRRCSTWPVLSCQPVPRSMGARSCPRSEVSHSLPQSIFTGLGSG